MRRLLVCLLVGSSLVACGGDDTNLFDNSAGAAGAGGGGAAGAVHVDSGQHADTGSTQSGGASGSSGTSGAAGVGTDSGVGPDDSVQTDGGLSDEGSAGSGGTTGSDASDVSVAPSDAHDSGADASESAVDSATGDARSDAAYCANGPAECPAPTNVCLTPTCIDYACGTMPAPQGWAIPTQTVGDCKRVVCDGAGSTQSVNEDSAADAPSDGNPCTVDGCSGGVPTHTPITLGTPCSGGFCNSAGQCVECLAPSDCGVATVCATPTCNAAGQCGVTYGQLDAPIPTQTVGDCHVTVCNSTGGTKSNIADNDKPDDSNICTDDTCSAGTPGHTVLTGHACGVSGVCDSQGACVGCNMPSDCGADDFCKARTCDNNTCGISFTPADTKLPDLQQPATKDCKKDVCDGNGNVHTVADDTDPPIDGNDCTIDECSGQTPQHRNVDTNTPCAGGVCDGAGACVECVSPANCPATGNPCIKATCDNHVCGTENNPPDTTCGVGPSCSVGQGHLQDKCSSGACVSGSNVSCSPYVCDTTACKTSCAGDGDCASGYTCDTGLSVCTNGPKCTDYCNTIMTNCTGGNAQYFSMAACLQTCATLPRGSASDGGGNTVGCRATHAGPGYAAVDPVTHCPHAGPGGAGVCSASNCDGFCTIALGACKGPNQAWATMDACMVDCAMFNTSPPYNASISSGDSYACRMWHLTAASVDPVTHCPHTKLVSATCY